MAVTAIRFRFRKATHMKVKVPYEPSTSKLPRSTPSLSPMLAGVSFFEAATREQTAWKQCARYRETRMVTTARSYSVI